MAAFIAAQRAQYGIPYAVACRALGVSQSWYYKWRHGDTSLRRARQQGLTALVVALFRRHRGRGDHGGAAPGRPGQVPAAGADPR